MVETLEHKLSRRERQIMDVLFQRGKATAAEVQDRMPEPPSYSAVRAHLRILEEKGHVKHAQDGPRYIYKPTMTKEKATQSALNHLVDTFFGGSSEKVMAALLDEGGDKMSDDELDRLAHLIEQAREKESRG
jgi:predicted transcriptional regulator